MPRAERPPVGSIAPVPRALAHPFIGSVQAHGVLLVVAEPHGQIVQVSANTASHLGCAPETMIGRGLEQLGAEVAHAVRQWLETESLETAHPRRVRLTVGGAPCSATLTAHRPGSGRVLVELEDFRTGTVRKAASLTPKLSKIVARLSSAHAIPAVADILVEEIRDLIGFDRVVVHRLDGEGQAEVIAESRRRGLDSHLHRRYPAAEPPALTQERHLRQRVQHLADAAQPAVSLVPPLDAAAAHGIGLASSILGGIGEPARLRLVDEGVGALFEASLVHEGRLWGLITGSHGSARHLPFELRAACELLAEVTSTRISALEHYAEAQAEVLVRRLEHRLVEATAADGDWRRALFETPRQLLQPLGATGAALFFDGEIHTTGEAPAPAELRELFQYLDTQEVASVFATASIAKLHPPLAGMARRSSGVLAVRLGSSRGEYLAWFRPEQPHDVLWGGTARGASSSRNAQDTWREAVRQTALPWKKRECAIAKAIGASLADIIVQLRAVRVLLAESQLATMRAAVTASDDPIIIADGEGEILLVNPALAHLIHGPHKSLDSLDDLAARFDEPERVSVMLQQLLADRRPWRGELRLAARGGEPGVPVALRADPIPSFDGGLFGVVVMLTDLTERHAADVARDRLQRAILEAQRPPSAGATPPAAPTVQALVAAIWANASVAVSEIADSADPATIAPLLQEVEAATDHAVRLSALLGRFSVESGRGAAE